MSTLFAIAFETFLRLRRDRVFIPALLVGVGLLALSGLASYWGVEEFFKILYDLGTMAYLFTGSIVALFWGNKIVSDSKQEGSLEVQLASPIGRSTWLLGKFLGLTTVLIFLGILFLIAWQGIYFSYGMGWMKPFDLALFGTLTLVWIVLAALSIFFASIATQSVALFCSIWMFVAGLISAPIMQALSPETPEETRKVVQVIAGLWNLHLFNISQSVVKYHIPVVPDDMGYRICYGLLLTGFFLSCACVGFQRKDIIA
ncbi:MAG: ABC transporter permease subunit [Chitinophagaceae bacterium]|nr:ABC transporter permease subunit [Oligoflexus sp.]